MNEDLIVIIRDFRGECLVRDRKGRKRQAGEDNGAKIEAKALHWGESIWNSVKEEQDGK